MVKEMEKKKNSTGIRGSRQKQATCIDERRDREEALCWINAAVRAVGRREKNQHAADFFP